jgi:hypothetical protein
MQFNKRELDIIIQALGYGTVFAKTQGETAEFALLKMKVEKQIMNDGLPISQVATGLPASTSLDGCPFHYCDKNPKCEIKCRYRE